MLPWCVCQAKTILWRKSLPMMTWEGRGPVRSAAKSAFLKIRETQVKAEMTRRVADAAPILFCSLFLSQRMSADHKECDQWHSSKKAYFFLRRLRHSLPWFDIITSSMHDVHTKPRRLVRLAPQTVGAACGPCIKRKLLSAWIRLGGSPIGPKRSIFRCFSGSLPCIVPCLSL